MAYYNRKKLLENTLYTIEKQKHDNLEIIIVDDASSSSEKVDNITKNYDLDIILYYIDPKEKTWMNPCIPNNIGFKRVTGDIVVIQSPECMHQGNILEHIDNNIKKNIYLNYACYSLDKTITDQIVPNYKLITNNQVAQGNGCNGWYNHSTIIPTGYHFCSAILKEDLYELGGFDERYANGLAYDDNEFLHRIRRKKMEIQHIDYPFVSHQFHEGVADRSFVKEGMGINYKIYEKTLKDNNWDVKKYNKYYN